MRRALAVVCLWSGWALAAEGVAERPVEEPPAVRPLPCRPTVACTAEILPGGYFEMEGGYAARSDGALLGHSAQLLLKYSLTDWLQVQVGTNNALAGAPGQQLRGLDGVTPVLKAVLWEQGTWLPTTSLSAQATFPTSGDATRLQGTIDGSARLHLSKDVLGFHGDLNVAVNVFDLGAARQPQGLVALALSHDLAWGFALMTEGYTTFGGPRSLARDGGWLSALAYTPVDALTFDLGADVGFYSGRAYTLFLGATWRLPVVRRVSPAPPASAAPPS